MVLSDTIQLVRFLQIKVSFQAPNMQHVADCGYLDAPHHMLLQRLCSTFNLRLLRLPASASQPKVNSHQQHLLALYHTGSEPTTVVQRYIFRAEHQHVDAL